MSMVYPRRIFITYITKESGIMTTRTTGRLRPLVWRVKAGGGRISIRSAIVIFGDVEVKENTPHVRGPSIVIVWAIGTFVV